jgi:ATP-dependent DNA helicase RecQ
MSAGAPATSIALPRILDVVRRYWGFDTLRPLQEQAIRAGIEHRDSLVVMPTGGGKSLCYQVPPALADDHRTDIVVSPLISLMKDQVDGLVANGYPAAALHSNLSSAERRDIEQGIIANRYRLLFVAPERLLTPWFLAQLERINVKAFAIDEAHCISQWGHDFRPEYRQLATLKDRFPAASIHAYTATATPRVRQDIVAQLRLENPNVLVGDFDRPNLIFRIVPKVDLEAQVLDTVRRHANEAVIVYCISRKDTEYMAEFLKANDVKAAAYHAGMEKGERSRVQEAFAEETLDVVVATVAFGMGIDRSNVRCVIHAAMPKTVEHYQQEAGRAGRDGLEAECIMFYSGGDVLKWESLVSFSAQKIDDPDLRMATVDGQMELLSHMSRMCGVAGCRHRALVQYFGQDFRKASCGACDFCLGEVDGMKDSTTIAQKILSCVARVEQRFGIGHVVDVLLGADTENIRKFQHNTLRTYGLMRDMDKKVVQNLVYQLVDQGLLDRVGDEYPVLKLNSLSIEVLKGGRDVTLLEPRTKLKKTRLEETSWEGVDRGLFEVLRNVRRGLALERGVPAFVILGDNTLRELAAVRPTSPANLRRVRGIGEVKAADFGQDFLQEIANYCHANRVPSDQFTAAAMVTPAKRAKTPNAVKDRAMQMFADGCAVDDVAGAIGRARSTVNEYLCEWIMKHKPADVLRWVDERSYQRVREAACGGLMEGRSVKPVFEALNGEVPYDEIRIVVAHIEALAQRDASAVR